MSIRMRARRSVLMRPAVGAILLWLAGGSALVASAARAAEPAVLDAPMQAIAKDAKIPATPPPPAGRAPDGERADRSGPEYASPGSDRAAGDSPDVGAVSIPAVPAVVRLPGQ